jgi:putative sterol carrier protein
VSAPLPFPSPEWTAAYGEAINASEDYRNASTEWTHGSVALVMPAAPAIGVPEDVGIWLDLDRGVCRAAKLVTRSAAQQAAFILTAEYRYWKQIIKKELGPIAGIMQRKVALQGSLPIVVRFIKSAEALVDAATRVPTRFLDDGH